MEGPLYKLLDLTVVLLVLGKPEHFAFAVTTDETAPAWETH